VLKESEEQLRFLSSQLLTAQETERRRLSRELHDEVGQALAVLKLRTDFIRESLDKDKAKAREECERSLHYIDQVIENVRRLSRDLSPAVLENVGLTAAIKWLVENITHNHQARVTLDLIQVDDLFSQDSKIMIFRVIQEALTNIVRHAKAKNISIAIKRSGNRVMFLIEDDGKGFNVVKAAGREAAKKGLGLKTMDERVRMLRGTLDLHSEEGKGTRITFTAPHTMQSTSDGSLQ
jgi:signal transduction histidine kinase